MFFEDLELPPELPGEPDVIIVEERHVLAGRRVEADVARGRCSLVRGRADVPEHRIGARDLGRAIGRSIVDDQHLEVE